MKSKIINQDLLPDHYIEVDQPYYPGNGMCSVHQLEEICCRFMEHVHQLRVREQILLGKLNAEIVDKKELEIIQEVISDNEKYHVQEQDIVKNLISNESSLSDDYNDYWVGMDDIFT